MPEMVADFLMTVLEPDWKHAIDMGSLVDRSNEFVPDRGAKRRGDFVWQASIDKSLTPEQRNAYGLDPDCKTICFYVMIEFQSTVDKKMALRVEAYESQLRLRLAETSGLPVPRIITFVLYSGERTWTAPTTTEPLMAHPLPGLPDDTYQLVDLNDKRWTANPVNNAFKIAAEFSQCKTVPQLQATLNEYATPISNHPIEGPLIRWLYDIRLTILKSGQADDELQPFFRNLDTRELKMTLIDRLTQDVERIRNEGREEGREEGRASAIVKILLKRFGAIPESLRESVHGTTDLAKLDELLDLSLSCETVEEFEEQFK